MAKATAEYSDATATGTATTGSKGEPSQEKPLSPTSRQINSVMIPLSSPHTQARERYQPGSPEDILDAVKHVAMEIAEVGKQSN